MEIDFDMDTWPFNVVNQDGIYIKFKTLLVNVVVLILTIFYLFNRHTNV